MHDCYARMGRNELNRARQKVIQKLTCNRLWRTEVSLLETTSSTSSTTPATTTTTTAATATITTSAATTTSTERHEYRTIDQQDDLKVIRSTFVVVF